MRWGVESCPIVLLMDGNDTPSLAAYGRGDALTPFYKALVTELGWTDLLGQDYGPTSITLQRRYRIDYVMAKAGDPSVYKIGAKSQPALEVKLVGIDPETGEKVLVERGEEAQKAVYGAPLPAVGSQPAIPSDHLHCSATITIEKRSPPGYLDCLIT